MTPLPLISIGTIFASDGSPSEVSTQTSNPKERVKKQAETIIVPEQVLALVSPASSLSKSFDLETYTQAWERYDKIRKSRSR